jgi:DMSO/TMAO reductase YedYZ molybdopterin-dependent catalytic subunit
VLRRGIAMAATDHDKPAVAVIRTVAFASWWRALLAATLSAGISIIVSLLFGIPTLIEAFGEGITLVLPLPLFSALLTLFGHTAKSVLVFTVLVLGVFLMAAVGALAWGVISWAEATYPAHVARIQRALKWNTSDLVPATMVAALVLLLWVIEAGIIAPILGGGVFGAALAGGIPGTFLAQLLPSAAFALLFARFLQQPARAPSPVVLSRASKVAAPLKSSRVAQAAAAAKALSRRRFLQRGALVLAGVAAGGLVLKGVMTSLGNLLTSGTRPLLHLGSVPQRITPPPVPAYSDWPIVSGQSAEVTPTADFYYVSKNLFSDPSVDISTWTLQIFGLVDHPYTLTYAQLQALPAIEQYHTLECISNDVGGPYISNALFRGVSLATLLQTAGIQPKARELVFHAADGYSDALQLDQALDPRTLVIYHINGEVLPMPHGFPARILVPGLYGMKNGKWLTGLEVGPGGWTGYWEQRGWTSVARVKIMARIDTPKDGDFLSGSPVDIAGIAYASDQGIAQVEVSVDGGKTWQPALLRRPLGPLAWTLWKFPWTPPSGRSILAVRAITLDGTVQQPTMAPPLPDGASGYDAISVTVA